jgi:hypothetical protein
VENYFCFIILFSIFQLHCSESQVVAPPVSGRLTVKIELAGPGPIDAIDIEVLWTGITIRPGSSGVATFTLTPGHYVLRVQGLNGPGPSLPYRDFPGDLHAGEEILITAIDCPMCVCVNPNQNL